MLKDVVEYHMLAAQKAEHGGIPEWPMGTDCKSVGSAFEGSNPSPSIYRGMEQLVARRAHNPKVVGSSPAPAIMLI